WMEHIDAMDHLRDGIGLRAYGNKNPVVEFKFESYEMFDEMVRLIREETLRRLYFARVERPPERRKVAVETQAKAKAAASAGAAAGNEPNRPKKAETKVGRNEPCPCGSGKKYKNCCGKAV
ncbi:MAG: SEC-C metal-binding domain-containing protein, partial [Clostridia bacterium]|nr:SEC-C metal-binding domain-containing protein [Clostridia bacterium]